MKLFLKSILIISVVFFSITSAAQDLPDPMSPPRLVNDFAEIFTSSEKADLEKILLDYNDSTSTQIYVVTVKDLQGYDAGDYAVRLGEKWGVGQKEKNNGAIILIKPKTGDSRGDVYIAVGYGLEPYLNDARIGRILDNYVVPYFRQNDYYGGAKAGIEAMMRYLSGEFQADEEEYGTSTGDIIWAIIILGIFIFIIYQSTKNSGNNGGSGSRGGGGFPPIFRGGGGRSSGGFGGGFGGGGGGSFGGGGAGRSW